MLLERALLFLDGSLLQVKGEPKIYYCRHGVRHWIPFREDYVKNFKGEKPLYVSKEGLFLMDEEAAQKKPLKNDYKFKLCMSIPAVGGELPR